MYENMVETIFSFEALETILVCCSVNYIDADLKIFPEF